MRRPTTSRSLPPRANDEGRHTIFSEWLKVSRANENDAVLVFSVGGGDVEKKVSVNIVEALKEAKSHGVRVLGIVGRDGGHTKRVGDAVVVVPTVVASRVTPHAEALEGVIWHRLVSHPKLQKNATRW